VQGLHYTTTSGLNGYTDANGQYNYRTGDTVIFDIGGVPINTVGVAGDPVVTALSVFGATSTADPQVVNLARLLLTLGGGAPNANNVIQLPATLPPLPSTFAFNVPTATFAAAIAAAGGGKGLTLVPESTATTHLAANFFAVSVTLAGSGSGSVASTPGGISCGSTCSYVFSTATQITLIPTGSGFAGWSGGTGSATVCNSIPGACTFTPTIDSNITATFNVAPPDTLIVSPAGTGTGTFTCSNDGGTTFGTCATTYANGTALILKATATSGSTFTGWTNGLGNATVCPNSPANCLFTLNTNTTVTVNFVLNAVTQFSVTAPIATGNGGGGTVLCNAGPCGSYPVNTLISMTPAPNVVSLFSGWSNGKGSVTANCGNAAGACTFTLTADTSLTANFNRPTLNVIVAGTGTVNSTQPGINNCTTNCTAPFDKSAAVTLTASGSGFSGWSGGGCAGNGSTCLVTLDVSKIVTATFGTVSAASTFKFIGAPGRQLLAVNPASPGTPTPVKVGGVDVILGNPQIAAGTTIDANSFSNILESATYSSGTTSVTNRQATTLLFVSGGKVYKASPLVSNGVPGSLPANEPQQVSNVTNAVACGTGSTYDLVNPNPAVGFNSPGQDGICNTLDDQIVIMHLNDSTGTAPVTLPAGTSIDDLTTVYSLTTGLALHVILVTSAGDLQWMDNTFVPTAITNGIGIGPVQVVAEQNDKVFLATPSKLYSYQPSAHTLNATPVVTADPNTVFVKSGGHIADLSNIFLVQSDAGVYKVPLTTAPGATITTKHFVAPASTVVSESTLSSGKIIIVTGISPSGGQFGVSSPCFTANPKSCNNGIIAVDKISGVSTEIDAATSQKAIFLNKSFNNYVLYTLNDPASGGLTGGALLRIEDASSPAVQIGQFGGWAGHVKSTSGSLVDGTFPATKQLFSQYTNVGPPAQGTVSVLSSPTGAPVSLGTVTVSPAVTSLPYFFNSIETTMIGQTFLQASPTNYQPFFIDTALTNSLTPITMPGAPAQWQEISN
jgi:hypothetical protein